MTLSVIIMLCALILPAELLAASVKMDMMEMGLLVVRVIRAYY